MKRAWSMGSNGWNSVSIVLLVTSTVALLPGGLFRFALPKLAIVLLACFAATMAQPRGKLPRNVAIAGGLLAAAFILVCLLSPTPWASLLGRWPRYEGIFALAAYGGAAWAGARVMSSRSYRTLWVSVALAAILAAGVAVLELFGLRPLGGAADIRPGSFFGNATDQGIAGLLFAVVLWPAICHQKAARNMLYVAGFGAAIVLLIASGSRGAYLGALVATLVFLVITRRFRSLAAMRDAAGHRWWLWLLAAGVGLSALLFIPSVQNRILGTATIRGRWMLWQESWAMFMEHPLAGIGPGRFVDLLPGFHTEEWSRTVGTEFPADDPHLWPLQAATAGGVLLLVPALILTVMVVASGLRRVREAEQEERVFLAACLAAFVGYSAVLLTAFSSPGTAPFAFFLAGALVACRTAELGKVTAPNRRSKSGVKGAPARASPAEAPRREHQWAKESTRLVIFLGSFGFIATAAAAELNMSSAVAAATAGQTQDADRKFSAAHALRTWDSDTAMLAAKTFEGPAAAGDRASAEAAVRWANLALAGTADSIEARHSLAVGLLNSGQPAAAHVQLEELSRRAPYNAEIYLQKGIAAFALGRVDDARSDLRTASRLNPSSPEASIVLAKIEERIGTDTGQQP